VTSTPCGCPSGANCVEMSFAFDTAPFFSDAFDVDVWIAEQVGPVPREIVLEQLRNDLGRYQSQLKAELVATVNRDYAGFVHLSSKMETFHDAVLRFQPPLSHVHDRLRALSIAVDDKLRRLKSLVRDRNAVRDAKALLHDFLRADVLIHKVEDVLQAQSGAENERVDDDVDTTTSRYVRVGNWLQELQNLQTKHAALPFFVLLSPRIKVIVRRYVDLLRRSERSCERNVASACV
jgi:conserved oligomeric Golgi complex subunit 2